jgi:hypothetical protein
MRPILLDELRTSVGRLPAVVIAEIAAVSTSPANKFLAVPTIAANERNGVPDVALSNVHDFSLSPAHR